MAALQRTRPRFGSGEEFPNVSQRRGLGTTLTPALSQRERESAHHAAVRPHWRPEYVSSATPPSSQPVRTPRPLNVSL